MALTDSVGTRPAPTHTHALMLTVAQFCATGCSALFPLLMTVPLTLHDGGFFQSGVKDTDMPRRYDCDHHSSAATCDRTPGSTNFNNSVFLSVNTSPFFYPYVECSMAPVLQGAIGR